MKGKYYFLIGAAILLIAASQSLAQQQGQRIRDGSCGGPNTINEERCKMTKYGYRTRQNTQRGRGNTNGSVMGYCLGLAAGAPLETAEQEDLLYLYEEEKMARNLYQQLGEQFQTVPVFKNITNSEDRHTARVASMLSRYSIDYSALAANPAGQFSNTRIQEKFNELITLGLTDNAEALRVGAMVEEADIADLKEAITATTHEDLRCVFTNLRNASINHLQAFVRNLERLGETYQPQIVSEEEYAELLTSSSTVKKMGRKDRKGRTR